MIQPIFWRYFSFLLKMKVPPVEQDGRPTRCFATSFALVIIIILFFLTDFVHAISRKQLDGFQRNFQDLCNITWTLCIFFCFDDITSGLEILPILWILKGQVVSRLSQ